MFYSNNFENNGVHIDDRKNEGLNFFNLPAPVGGNFYDSYTACSDGDGFCDTAYSPANAGGKMRAATDNLPLA